MGRLARSADWGGGSLFWLLWPSCDRLDCRVWRGRTAAKRLFLQDWRCEGNAWGATGVSRRVEGLLPEYRRREAQPLAAGGCYGSRGSIGPARGKP